MAAPTDLLQERIGRVQRALKEDFDAPMLVTGNANLGWLTGIPADFQKDAALLISPQSAVFVTDGRYENRIPEIPGVTSFIWGAEHPHRWPELSGIVESDTLVLDTTGIPLDVFQALPQMIGVETLKVPSGFLDKLRMIKGERELELIREALGIAIGAFRWAVGEWLPANLAGKTDMDFREALETRCEEKGGEGMSFDTIVAMDEDADTPHPDMTRDPRPLAEGTVMLLDFGIVYKGVCTDLTRMIVLGRDELPEEFAEMRRLQESWMEAVVERMQPGKPAYEAGQAYVDGLKEAGIDKPFHGAGHGTGGAYVHELPRVGPDPGDVDDYGIPFSQSLTFEPGMIVTSEPGMYRNGVGAYRTENMVLITPDGQEAMDAELPLDPFYVKAK
jgi:Xaa-Pro aminopeptidase